ncbi:uncharacterized protein LOC114076856 [Solanum pennellii]|uniref:Uncharacterized protein LOC114076856 n=1 Tax=Solanum pennellii TaxID=28526 RepID=A0ABM1V9E4_SOLPN|nr:uncharacterized protein LOC114076856 [Solanum pennellii]
MTTQDQVVTNNVVAQVKLGVGPQPNASTIASRIHDFMRMNSPTFHGTNMNEDPQGFIYEVFKVVDAMSVTPKEQAELVAYQLKDGFKLMVYTQQIEESKLREMHSDGKRPRSDEPSQPKIKKRFYNPESPVGNNYRVSNKNSQGGGYAFERPRCTSCWKQHLGRCLAGTYGCFECGNTGHKMRDFPCLKETGKEVNQSPHGGLDPNSKDESFLCTRS